jgi:spore maturation protein CgeB
VSEELFAHISGEGEIVKASFLGNPDFYRARNVMRLVESGVPVDVYGYRWDRHLRPSPSLNVNGPVRGEEMLRVLRRYRVQLNFFRPHNADSHNMRTFEVPACGGIMLAQDSVEHRDFFENGREAFYFKTTEEMIDLTWHLLTLPKPEADAVRAAARLRSVHGGYSYRHRALAAFAEIEKVRLTK